MPSYTDNLSLPNKPDDRSIISGLEDNYTRILKAATSEFLANGYDDTRLDEIVQNARVSKTSIYKYFGGKRELFIAMVEHVCEQVVHSVYKEQDLKSATYDDVKATLNQWGQEYLKNLLQKDRLAMFRLNMSMSTRIEEAALIYFKAGPEKLKTLIADYLQQISDANILIIPNTELAAAEFMAMARSDLHIKALFNPNYQADDETISKSINSAVNVFMRAYKTNNIN